MQRGGAVAEWWDDAENLYLRLDRAWRCARDCLFAGRARPILVWNATTSAPLGLYSIAPFTRLQNGDLVLVQPDPANAAVYAERGYLPLGVPLLKRVGALGGMRVCEHAGDVTIEGRHVANALPSDGRGRPMTPWSGCRALSDDEFFVLNADVPTSLDGRYFGPSLLLSVIGRATPVWTLKDG